MADDAWPYDNIVPTTARVEVRVDGRLLATTNRAMKLDETGLPSRYYLPPEDVRMDLLRATTFRTNCPFKGEASYWSLDITERSTTASVELRDANGSGRRSKRDAVDLP